MWWSRVFLGDGHSPHPKGVGSQPPFITGNLPVLFLLSSKKINILPPSGKTVNEIQKWMTPFRMGTTSSTTMQSLGEIGQRAPAVGAKIWCLYVFIGRMPRSGKLLVLDLLTGQKSGFSPRRGDSLHRCRSNFAGPTCTWVRLAVQNFMSIGSCQLDPLTDFKNFQGFLYA